MSAPTAILPGQTRQAQYRRGLACLAVGAAILAVCHPWGFAAYYYVPLISGGGLVLAAVAGGRGSRLMGPALPIAFWGAAKVLDNTFQFTGDFALPTGMIGLGLIVAYLVDRAGWFPLNNFATGAGVLWIGLGQFIHGQFNEWVTFYSAAFLGLVAVVEFLAVSTARNQPSYRIPATALDLPDTQEVPAEEPQAAVSR